MSSLGERLKALRASRDLSLRAVAEKSGVPFQVLHKLEHKTDLGSVQAETLKRLAHVYGVSIDYLAGVYDSARA